MYYIYRRDNLYAHNLTWNLSDDMQLLAADIR